MKLTIKDKEYGLHFGIGAAEIAADVLDLPVDTVFFSGFSGDLDKPDDVEVSKELIFGAILNWCEENDTKYEASYNNFRNAFNDMPVEDKKEIKKLYFKSRFNGRIVEDLFKDMLDAYELSKKESDNANESKKKPVRQRKSSKTSSDGGGLTIVE